MVFYRKYRPQAIDDLDETSVREQLKNILSQLSRYGKNYEELTARVNSVLIELKDISAEVENANDSVTFDQNKLEEITAQLDLLKTDLVSHLYQSAQADP